MGAKLERRSRDRDRERTMIINMMKSFKNRDENSWRLISERQTCLSSYFFLSPVSGYPYLATDFESR